MTIAPTRPVQPAGRPPAGAARLSKTWVDDRGLPHVDVKPVPVDENDCRTAHVLHVCSKGEIEVTLSDGTTERRPCDRSE